MSSMSRRIAKKIDNRRVQTRQTKADRDLMQLTILVSQWAHEAYFGAKFPLDLVTAISKVIDPLIVSPQGVTIEELHDTVFAAVDAYKNPTAE